MAVHGRHAVLCPVDVLLQLSWGVVFSLPSLLSGEKNGFLELNLNYEILF